MPNNGIMLPVQEQILGIRRKQAYCFDGTGKFLEKNWDIGVDDTEEDSSKENEFFWYHVELPRSHLHQGSNDSYLLDALSPPLTLLEIVSLFENGPYCSMMEDSIVFRVNSPGPAFGVLIPWIEIRMNAKSMVSVSHGTIARMEFEEGDDLIPPTASDLLIHILNAYVDHIHNIFNELEMQLDVAEIEFEMGGSATKREMLEDRWFSKMQLNLQRLLQVVAHGEQVFPMVKEKLSRKSWFVKREINSLKELIGRYQRLKENIGIRSNRINAIQVGLDSWQIGEMNWTIFLMSVASIFLYPTSILVEVFGMNIGGVPWTSQNARELGHGFLYVMLFISMILVFQATYIYRVWRRRKALERRLDNHLRQ